MKVAVYTDNAAAVALTTLPGGTWRTRHLRIKSAWIRDEGCARVRGPGQGSLAVSPTVARGIVAACVVAACVPATSQPPLEPEPAWVGLAQWIGLLIALLLMWEGLKVAVRSVVGSRDTQALLSATSPPAPQVHVFMELTTSPDANRPLVLCTTPYGTRYHRPECTQIVDSRVIRRHSPCLRCTDSCRALTVSQCRSVNRAVARRVVVHERGMDLASSNKGSGLLWTSQPFIGFDGPSFSSSRCPFNRKGQGERRLMVASCL